MASGSGLYFLVKFPLKFVNSLFVVGTGLVFYCCFLFSLVFCFKLFFAYKIFIEQALFKKIEWNQTEFQSKFPVFSQLHISHNCDDLLIKFYLIIIVV